jgi:hypothetical protein
MPLSNIEIHQALDAGRLVITPEPRPRLPVNGQECPYNTHSVDLCLSPNISIPKKGPYSFDVMQKGSLADFISSNSRKVVIDDDAGFSLPPNMFILAQTKEVRRIACSIGTQDLFGGEDRRQEQPSTLRVADSFYCPDRSSWLGRAANFSGHPLITSKSDIPCYYLP